MSCAEADRTLSRWKLEPAYQPRYTVDYVVAYIDGAGILRALHENTVSWSREDG